MPPRPRSGRRPYPGGQFNDPEHIPDPAKAQQARQATAQGPPEGFPPLADGEPTAGPRRSRRQTPDEPAPAERRSTPAAFVGGGPEWSDGGGFLLGLLLYVLGLNYLRHGPEGVKAWFMAKLFNRVTQFPDDPVAPVPSTYSGHGITA